MIPYHPMMTNQTMGKVIDALKKESKQWDVPVVTLVAMTGHHPFRVLISCLLSLRTNDRTTAPAVKRLFAVADTADGLLKISIPKLEKLIYPVGFYRTKAKQIHAISRMILNEYKDNVPDTVEELTKLPGVGRKTANLVVSQGHKKHADIPRPQGGQ